MAKQLNGVEGEFIFFCAYLADADEGKAAEINGNMLHNFLKALTITGAEKKLKRLLLTCGMKQYGVHLGQPKNPMDESDKWLEAPDRPPNFYYDQQRILADYAKNKHWDWVCTYPQDVIGVAKGNFMNLATSIGIYAAVNQALHGSELPFPGNEEIYLALNIWTHSKLHAEFALWAMAEPKCGNENFNVVNGDVNSWQNLWPKMARRFGCTIPKRQFDGPGPDPSETMLAPRPPIDDYATELGMEGRFGPNKLHQRIDLSRWSQRPEVKDAWMKLAKEHGLQEDALANATWGFLAFLLGRNYNMVGNMTKAHKLGWAGYEDTWESMENSLDALEDQKILPPTKR